MEKKEKIGVMPITGYLSMRLLPKKASALSRLSKKSLAKLSSAWKPTPS